MRMPDSPADFAYDGIAVLVIGGIVGLFLRENVTGNVGNVVLAIAVVGGGILLVIAAIAKAVQVGVRSSRD